MAYKRSVITLHNPSTRLQIALSGGAIVDFHLTSDNLNPLTFCFSKDQMPERNRAGAPYQGHFLCLGRWGEPSSGEKLAGLPDHGQFANQEWQSDDSNHSYVHMFADSRLEGLYIDREIFLHKSTSVFACKETVRNTGVLGRVFNMVQHPTIAAPYLNASTKVFCNAVKGFPFQHHNEIAKYETNWPIARLDDFTETDMRNSLPSETSVHSYIVDPDDKWGWVVAVSNEEKQLIGYLWKRTDYPWINLWRDYYEGQIRYRGLEFGTSGVHQPFPEVMKAGCYEVFGERVFAYIDAGESITKKYCAFLLKTESAIKEVKTISLKETQIYVETEEQNFSIALPDNFNF